ncbi:TPA: heavy metal-binding domain-containing protein, partial [Pseudomonas putida]|nr:heavy metal-binding domain-containing protein [Pseudomonas putida]
SALREAREQATEELKARARQLQADAVVGVDFEISMPSVQGGMVVVFATGTAVRLK